MNIKTDYKTLNYHHDFIWSLLLLKDNRIASCSNDHLINIYDPSNDYALDISITDLPDKVNSICQLDNENLISSCNNNSIYIWHITKTAYHLIHVIKQAHFIPIQKIVSLSNNYFASCSDIINIWNLNFPYVNKPFKTISIENYSFTTMLYINNQNLLIASSYKENILLFNMKTYQCVTFIDEAYCFFQKAMYQIDSNHIVIGYRNIVYMIDIDTGKKEMLFELKTYINVYSFIKVNNILLCGSDHGKIYKYDIEKKSLECIKSNNNHSVFDIVQVNKDEIAFSVFSTIKVWKISNDKNKKEQLLHYIGLLMLVISVIVLYYII